MAPLANTRVIHRNWSGRHRRPLITSMNARVTIGAPDGEAVPQGDDFVQPYTDAYTGPARVQALNDSNVSQAAGQTVSGRAYLVQLGADASDIAPGMRVKVLAAQNDPDLIGQDLWVTDPQLGSERFTRDVVCSDNQTDAASA